MEAFKAILISIVVLLAGAGFGRFARKLWSEKHESWLEQIVLDTALGMGLLSLVIFALGLLQLFRPIVLVFVIALSTLALLASAIRNRLGGSLALPPPSRLSTFRFPLSTIIFLVITLAAIIPAAAPPAMSDWDSLAYHLAVPKLYIEHGGIYNIGIMSHSNFPFLMEMLYIPGVMLNCPEAARVLNFFVGILLIASVWLLTKRHFSAKAAPMAALGLAGMPIVLFLATTAYIDLATTLYTVISIYLLLNYLDTRERAYIIGSAIAAGFAASTKMTGLVTIPLIVAWLIIDRFAAERKIEWKRGLMFVGVAFLACAPWYIKTFIYTGNPVYPFFYGLFGGRNWTPDMANLYAASQAKFGMGHDITAFLMLPWNLAFHSEKFYDTPFLFVGPMFLVSVPLLFAAKYRSRKSIGLLGFFLAYIGIWFMLTHQSRYLIPAFAVLAVLVSAIVYEDERLKYARWALGAIFAVTAVFGIFTLWPAITRSAPVVFGKETREQYLSHALDIYPAQQFMNEHLPADARVAFMGDTRGFYLNREYIWADYGHNLEFSRRYLSAEDFVQYLKSRHVTHVMINFRFFPKRGDKTSEPVYQAIDKGLLSQIYPMDTNGGVAVYEVKS
ncbi:MAG: glycosyltransferase family 39 protein [Armatimonadetes bacterium]|nr:glycosyltransferase family 39 protein [Armatimonadota bacterium]